MPHDGGDVKGFELPHAEVAGGGVFAARAIPQ